MAGSGLGLGMAWDAPESPGLTSEGDAPRWRRDSDEPDGQYTLRLGTMEMPATFENVYDSEEEAWRGRMAPQPERQIKFNIAAVISGKLIGCCTDRTVRAWDLKTGEHAWTYQVGGELYDPEDTGAYSMSGFDLHELGATSMLVLPDGRVACFGEELSSGPADPWPGGLIRVFDVGTGKLVC